jgi:hypothetical protein
MKKVQRSLIFAAAAICLPMAITRCNVHGSSPDLDQYDHPVEAGEEAAVSTGDDSSSESDDASSTSSPEASSEAGEKDGSAKDGGDAGDAGDEPPGCSTPHGGAACTPRSVACGSSSCTTPADVCCAGSVTTSPPTGTCGPSSTCGLGTTVVACEEAADCASGVCCETPAIGGAPGTQTCAASCTPITSYQICRSNTECAGDAGCVPQSCPNGLSTYNVEACGLQTGCTATN